jgi:quinohemoprotein ethanol dehydrogenase
VVLIPSLRWMAAAGLALASLPLLAQSAPAKGPAPRRITDAVLRAAGTAADPEPGSWLTYGKTQGETRYSTLNQINDTNVKRLGLAYTYVVGAGGSNQEGTPLAWNNTIYGITAWSVVFAVEAKSGKEIWRWDPEVNQATVRSKICCGIVNRGIALYNNMIIAPAVDGRLFALDAFTGKPIWETRVAYPQDNFTITMAPRIAGGKVIVGLAGGDKPTRGRFDAFDAMTGKHSWRFYTIPGPADQPYENAAMRAAAKTWSPDFNFKELGGGGAVWDGFAYDPEANLVYVGTGNAEPWVQNYRGGKGYDNLYACSILAVDLTTGQLKWHYQTVPNDNWDFDSVQQLMLLTLNVNGKPRKVITQAAKNGFYYVLDRVSGEFLTGTPFVKVNWATGLDEKGRPKVSPEAYYDEKEGLEIYPTGGGAHNWSPMSFNPKTGLVYIPASYSPFPYQMAPELKPGTTGYMRPTGDLRKIKDSIGPIAPDGVRGGLQAWDPVNRKLVWQAAGGGGIGGGSSTTAGNLVFQVTNDGLFRALTADKGDKLYEIQTGRTGMAPPITFEAEGKQYVAFLGGVGRPAAQIGPNDAKIDSPVLMYVFTLDGKAEMPKPAAPPVAPPKPAAAELAN